MLTFVSRAVVHMSRHRFLGLVVSVEFFAPEESMEAPRLYEGLRSLQHWVCMTYPVGSRRILFFHTDYHYRTRFAFCMP